MNRESEKITEDDLHAYLDGQLEQQKAHRVEQYIAENPEAAERVKEYMQFNRAFHCLYDDTLNEPIPYRLQPNNFRKPRNYIQDVAVIFLSLTLGMAIGWYGRDVGQAPNENSNVLVKDAFTSHVVYTPEIRHPVEVPGDEKKHLVAWLSKRLKTKVKAPALTDLGYELLGGRLLGTEGQPAAQFMYQNSSGQRLTLFLRQRHDTESETAFRFADKDGIHGFYWIDTDLAYVLIGDLDKDKLSYAAHMVYTSLN